MVSEHENGLCLRKSVLVGGSGQRKAVRKSSVSSAGGEDLRATVT